MTNRVPQTKITKHAFSGGRETKEEQEKYGGNPDIDVAYQYLTYFEDDDAKLATIAEDYRSGKMLTGQLKGLCIELLQQYVAGYQARREKVTDEVLRSYMTPRRLNWGGNPNPKKPEPNPAKDESKSQPKLKEASLPIRQKPAP